MEELNIIYRILKYLQKSLDCDEFNPEGISPERLHISRSKWQKLLIRAVKKSDSECQRKKFRIFNTALIGGKYWHNLLCTR